MSTSQTHRPVQPSRANPFSSSHVTCATADAAAVLSARGGLEYTTGMPPRPSPRLTMQWLVALSAHSGQRAPLTTCLARHSAV